MSLDIMNRIWWRDDLDTMEKFVALALANIADDEGVSWPSVDKIALVCACTRRTVQNCTRRLEEKRLLRIVKRQDRSNYYIFNIDYLPHTTKPPAGPKERRIARYLTDPASEPDLFATGAPDSPLPKMTGESGSMTGESGSMTGAGDSPIYVRDTSEDTSGGGAAAAAEPLPAVAEVQISLSDYVEAEWQQLKNRHPGVAGIRKIDDGLADQLKHRAKAHAFDNETAHDVWRLVFEAIETSPFLTGRAPPGRGRDTPFKLSIGWLVRPANFREVLNGRYSDDEQRRGNRPMGPAETAGDEAKSRLRSLREQRRAGGDPAGVQPR